MFRIIRRNLTILLVASAIAGVTYLLVQTLGGQAAASTMQQFGDHGGPNAQSPSLAGLGQVLMNLVEAGVIIAVVYRLQRWWLGRRQTRLAGARRAVATAR